MQFLVGENWKNYFDVVIVQARKPRFFTEETRPLRIYDEVKQTQLWDRVTKLDKGIIYLEVILYFDILKNYICEYAKCYLYLLTAEYFRELLNSCKT